jgi:radical SAM protein (TIGR01212 family)
MYLPENDQGSNDMTDSAAKRYNPFSEELKRLFGCKVQRISIDAGLTCPNRDGTLSSEGCIFCSDSGSGSYSIKRELPVSEQIKDGKKVMRSKYRAAKFIAYFQAFSNTYASVGHLRGMFSEALDSPDVVGLIIATRPDCLPDAILDYLQELNNHTYLWLELGIQSIHDKSLKFINRRHDHACTRDAVRRAKSRGLRVCAHIIVGLPGETREDLLATASELNRLGIDGVKVHLLHVMKGTKLAEMHDRGEIRTLDRDEYTGMVCDVLESLDPRMLIHRLTGDGGHDNLVAPLWSLKKFEVLNLVDGEMKRRGTMQGFKFYP